MWRRILKSIQREHARLQEAEHLYMVLLALFVGVGGGFAAVGFRYLIGFGQEAAWQASDLPELLGMSGADGAPLKYQALTLDYIRALPWWWKVGAPAIGGLLCAAIVYYFAREAKGHGVPEVMEAVALRGGRIRPRVVFAKMFASAISIASGGSVGREGPIVQIGSALGSTIGQWLRLDERQLRTLVGCGAAAGIAATFNAPVAGALFALEIILADFGVAQFAPIVISSVVATVIGHQVLGDAPAFVVPQYGIVNYNELFAYAALGIMAGLVALAFVRVLYWTEDLFDGVKFWAPGKAVVGGVTIGVIGLWFPEIFGVGYEAIDHALGGQMLGWTALALVGIKIVAVSITIGSGGSGGIFAPSLFIGAMVGAAFGSLINAIWPDATAGAGAYALVGMVAVVAATTHAPITAILIIFELTKDYEIMLSLMIAAIIATLVATQLQKGSIYTIKLLRRGVDIRKGQDVSLLRHVFVRDEMRTDPVTVAPGTGLMQVIGKLIEHPGYSVFVVDENHRLRGVITANQGRPFLTDPEAFQDFIIAGDMMQESEFPTVGPGDTLAHVMQRLSHYRGEIPVVDEDRLVGAIWPEDVIERYNTELFKREMASSMVSSVTRTSPAEPVPVVMDTSIAELRVPPAFVGHSLGSLGIRVRYDVTILMIKQRAGDGSDLVNAVPSADYVFKAGDVVLVMGKEEQLRRFERGELSPADELGP